MNDVFLIDNGRLFKYTDLLNTINKNKSYYPLFKTHDLFAYFTNVVTALATGQSLTLLDADLTSSEIEEINEADINKIVDLHNYKFTSISDVISNLQNSVSRITIFTSGTTGQPKKVVHTIDTLTRSVRIGDKYCNDIWAYAYNPTHMAGLQVFLQAFENINTLVNVFNMSRSDVYQLIEKYEITHISATPTFYRLLLPFEQSYFSIKRVTFGGEKSDAHLHEAVRKIFPEAKVNNIYASTEAGSLFVATGNCFQITEKLRNKFKVDNDELLIHYSLLGKSDNFKFDGEYYRSGDLIEWINQKEGFFRFKSRKNELINIGGYKVNPTEVEDVLLEINGIQQALVYGKSNSVLGNILCADIQIERDLVLTELDIRKILKERLQDFKIPRRIKFIESLSLTRTGKLKRS